MIFDSILALYWFAMFVALFFGYEPSVIVSGCSFFIAALSFVYFALDKYEKKKGW